MRPGVSEATQNRPPTLRPSMEKNFTPGEVEPRWRERWSEQGLGVADPNSGRRPFVIALPPPNITAELHLGHAAGSSVQDILARRHRMLGDEVEWCPGTDHAAIATQAVLERRLAAEGTTKEAIGRGAWQELVDSWYATTGGRILEQLRGLGFSCDWSRTRFTMDPQYVRAIRTVFAALHRDGLIYRGPRIVNWCPHNLSAISDEEVTWVEHTDAMVRLRYPVEGGGEVVVATVRPETMLGDSAVAVAPGDPRYADLVGRTVVLPITGRRVPIVEDAGVEAGFGTGALKVTPGHDPLDHEIGVRHGLAVHTVIGLDGRMDVPDLPRFHGLTVMEARAEVTAALREAGAVVAEEAYVHDVGHCDRCGAVIEPLVSTQWWVHMQELAAPAISAVEEGRIRFHPDRPHTEVYLAWMRNIRDWCISRQLWLGHAIPVSTCDRGHEFAWVDPPAACPECGSTALMADPDVLDTWFSSALWPFAIFGWPDDTDDLRAFYPGSVLVTAREIIFLWVARMIMTGMRFAGGIPFTDVIINSTIQAADGSRMSKSKGNGVDPLQMIDRYGADAVRAWAGSVGTAGQDMRFDETRIDAFRSFANKLWSVTRLLVTRLGDGDTVTGTSEEPARDRLAVEDRWLLAEVAATVTAVDAAMAAYRFHEAMERLYDTVERVFCDAWVELAKPRMADDPAARWTAVTALDVLLRLLHPFMPFVTEECAQRLPAAAPSLQQRPWPVVPEWWATPGPASAVGDVLELATALRSRRQEAGVAPRTAVAISVGDHPLLPAAEVRRLLAVAPRLWVLPDGEPAAGARAVAVVAAGLEAVLHLPGGAASDPTRLRAQHEHLRERVAGLERKLSGDFGSRAPATVVAGARNQLEEARRKLDAVERALAEVPV